VEKEDGQIASLYRVAAGGSYRDACVGDNFGASVEIAQIGVHRYAGTYIKRVGRPERGLLAAGLLGGRIEPGLKVRSLYVDEPRTLARRGCGADQDN
jgi:hypothetical protein